MRLRERDRWDVVVVGAGMVGASAALALEREGLKVALVEDQPATAPSAGEPVDLRVVAIAPHAQALLAELGVWPAIAAMRASPYTRMEVTDALAQANLHFDASDYGWQALGHIVENRLVAGALWAALERSAVQRYQDRVAHHVSDAQGVRVQLAGGAALDARLLIAADGVHSKLRADSLIGVDGAPYGQSALVAHIELERPHAQTAWQRFLPSGPLAFLPLLDGRASIVWTLPGERAQALSQAEEADFIAQLVRASDGRYGRLQLASARALFPLRLQIAQRFAAERLILIGDAAHVVHPLAGQGVNLGFQDVLALRDLVRRARARQRSFCAASDLARWARARRSEATLAARSFDALNRLYAVHDGPLLPLRALGLNLVDRLSPLKRKLAEQAAGIRAG